MDVGAIDTNGSTFHANHPKEFIQFIKGKSFLCGHNVLLHDLTYIQEWILQAGFGDSNVIDTLFLSPLFFPNLPYHKLLKNDKLQSESLNNPLNDSIKAKELFDDEVAKYYSLPLEIRQLFKGLLAEQREFKAFFRYVGSDPDIGNLETGVQTYFKDKICHNATINNWIQHHPIALAYALALIHGNDRNSITPGWVLKNYPETDRITTLLRGTPCIVGCIYCNDVLDIHKGLQRFFGFEAYRRYGGEALQENAVQAAINRDSLLAIFPTGGGKSITFQVPALMSGETSKSLTVVISPLQSLMKDQVDNLEAAGITDAVTINGLLDPIERAKALERIADGRAKMLYISPESLRSPTIERLLLGRKIERFVIDEAHCFSSWGQDFRVDYLYIADFILRLQQLKNLSHTIPVSCFTATAKRPVIDDILQYFEEKLGLQLQLFSSNAGRTNLQYKVLEQEDKESKYAATRELLLAYQCPSIVYVSKTKGATDLASRLSKDGIQAKAYHGKMEARTKIAHQNAFINGELPVIVATSAFGMGVDKKDVGLVIHYELSNSLENYVQEAGRAGRDPSISANCYVLFNEEDLNKHFILLGQTKLSIKEIQQVWKAVKNLTKIRSQVSNSALEIARQAGWDDTVQEIETRVTTAIAALENAGYLKRGKNMPRVYANSIQSQTAQEAIERIQASRRFTEKQKVKAIRVIKKLFSQKRRSLSEDDEGESRIDYLADHLSLRKYEIIEVVSLLRAEKILADAKDLTAFIQRDDKINRSLRTLDQFSRIERFLLSTFTEEEATYHLKDLNEQAEEKGCVGVNPSKLKTIFNIWNIRNWIKRHYSPHSRDQLIVKYQQAPEELLEKCEERHLLARFILQKLFTKSEEQYEDLANATTSSSDFLVEFSVLEIHEAYTKEGGLFAKEVNFKAVEEALFYLSRIGALKIEGGFLVVYNRLTLDRLEHNNLINYKKSDYQTLEHYYANKVEQIHIAGEYARKMVRDYQGALQFVEDYFQLNYSSFLRKYFPGGEVDKIKRPITPAKFQELFGRLSPTQLEIIKDNESPHLVVTAGPGSGKTKVLVHKLASLMQLEDVKHEQLLMVTFSRAAANEFKKRLKELIGGASHFVQIQTFHAYCFDLLGKVGTLDLSQDIIQTACEKIRNREVEPNRITKTVLVIDEAQDMNADEFALVQALMEHNENMRVIAVGDDDQNIYEFRGSSAEYMKKLIDQEGAKKWELVQNFRSRQNLVHFSNQFVTQLHHRLKSIPIVAQNSQNGNIKLVLHQHNQLIVPLVEDLLSSDLAGSVAVLTQSNFEAFQINGLLVKHGLPSKLIQSNDGFQLLHLQEVRFFFDQLKSDQEKVIVIPKETWKAAIKALKHHFSRSSLLEQVLLMFRSFQLLYPKKNYKSDLELFFRESKLEDFVETSGETIFVSTIHKAKGREFDRVFLLLENFRLSSEEEKRKLYVALTRAKTKLNIHLNGSFLQGIQVENLSTHTDHRQHEAPEELAIHLSLKDVWLDYFITRQHLLKNLMSGDHLLPSEQGCTDSQGYGVLRFSKSFQALLASKKQLGYTLHAAKVNLVLYWKKEGSDAAVKVVLPEVWLRRG